MIKALIYSVVFFACGAMAAEDNPRLKVVQDKVQSARENYFTGKEDAGLTKHNVTTPLDIWSATCYKIPLKSCTVPRDAWGKYTGLPLPPMPAAPKEDTAGTSSTSAAESSGQVQGVAPADASAPPSPPPSQTGGSNLGF